MQALSARHALLGGSPGIRTSPTARSARRARPVAVAARSDAGSNLPGALSVADLAAPVLKSHGMSTHTLARVALSEMPRAADRPGRGARNK